MGSRTKKSSKYRKQENYINNYNSRFINYKDNSIEPPPVSDDVFKSKSVTPVYDLLENNLIGNYNFKYLTFVCVHIPWTFINE